MKWFRYNYRKIAYFITPVQLYCVEIMDNIWKRGSGLEVGLSTLGN